MLSESDRSPPFGGGGAIGDGRWGEGRIMLTTFRKKYVYVNKTTYYIIISASSAPCDSTCNLLNKYSQDATGRTPNMKINKIISITGTRLRAGSIHASPSSLPSS